MTPAVRGWLEIVRRLTSQEDEALVEEFLQAGHDRSALPVLEEAASNDPDERVRAVARQALKDLRERFQVEDELERERTARARRGK